MTQEEIKVEIKDIIHTIAPDEDLSVLTDDGVLREQIELDSMDFLDIVMELKKQHKIEVPQEDYPQLASMNSCVEYLTPKFQ